jgi:hypothetical protein
MSERNEHPPGAEDGPGSRKRRRRRRRRGGGEGAEAQGTNGGPAGGERGGSRAERAGAAERDDGGRSRRGRRLVREDASSEASGVQMPPSGRGAHKSRGHRRRGRALAGTARRVRIDREDLAALTEWFDRMADPLLQAIARALNVSGARSGDDRLPALVARALITGNRVSGIVQQLHPRDRQALAALVQCGGLAHADEFFRELVLMLGGREGDWARTMTALGDKGLVFASAPVEDGLYYLIPEPLMGPLQAALSAEMTLPTFEHDEVRVVDARPFCPPLDFSLATLATYLDQRPPKLTQRQEVFKQHKDELDRFFGQVWAADSELFSLHYDFLMMHGMIELRGDGVAVNRDVVEEWLELEPEDQRDLVFRALDKRFPFAEFVLAAVHAGEGAWIAEAPLQALYRRWKRGEDWRGRYHKGIYASPRGADREGYSFTPLVASGMLELGLWGQQKFFRLTARARDLLDPAPDDGFRQFYLTPSYEIMAPAGLAPVLLFRIGELAELSGCDRANTYKITEASIERALQKGWRRENILDFLRDNSQIGLPENVEQTLRGWMGPEGDVELHELVALTVHRSAVRKIEGSRQLKPFLIHRFAPGLYAVDRHRMDELRVALKAAGFNPPSDTRRYPSDLDVAAERHRLHQILAEARDQRNDPLSRAQSADTLPEDLRPIPGTSAAQSAARERRKREDRPPRAHPNEIRAIVERAITDGRWLELVYVSAKDNTRKNLVVAPERIALNREGNQVLVGTDTQTNVRLTYTMAQIERARSTEARADG